MESMPQREENELPTDDIDLKNIRPRQRSVAYLAATGLKQVQIAKETGYKESSISILLQKPRMQFEVRRLQGLIFGKDAKKRFDNILPNAIGIAEGVMMDESNKPALRLNAAQDFMDRGAGKPKQDINIEGSLFRMLLERLDKAQEAQSVKIEGDGSIIDVTPAGEQASDKPEEERRHAEGFSNWYKENMEK